MSFFKIRGWVEFAANLSIVCALIIAGFEYFAARQNSRIERSITYLDRVSGAHMREHWQKITQPWQRYNLTALSELQGNAQVLDRLALEFVEKDPVLRSSLIAVVEEIDLAAACIETKFCDKTALVTQIGEQVTRLQCLYSAPLMQIREKRLMEGLGRGIGVITGERQCND